MCMDYSACKKAKRTSFAMQVRLMFAFALAQLRVFFVITNYTNSCVDDFVAGGVVTHDELRSLAISQRLLGTKEIVLIHHTDCGMLTFTDDDFKAQVQKDTGIKPSWAAESFKDLDEDVRQSIARIKAEPSIPHKDSIRGFVYDVHTGQLREVSQ